MATSSQTVAAVTLTTEVDVTELVRIRTQLGDEMRSATDVTPSYNDLLIRLVARAIDHHPGINASFERDQLRLHSATHIGLAVDTDDGLKVPVVRNAQLLTVFEIAEATSRLITSTREGSIQPDNLTGSTFTITNLGMFGIDAFSPIVNVPEIAVLGIGRITPKPVVLDEAEERLGIRKMMALSLTFDHRAIDGAPAARFLQTLTQMIERPLRWLM
jgi:pyruvate dehydrogenase E2 component (dihydrolipoamide acetyltransferase)